MGGDLAPSRKEVAVLGRLRIRTKLLVVVVVPLAAMVIVAAVGGLVLRSARIGGNRYATIKSSNALVADVLPPPGFIIEAYLTVSQMVGAEDSEVPRLIVRYDQAKSNYLATISKWNQEETDPEIRKSLLTDADASARRFFEIGDQQLIPALRNGDRATAGQVANTEMRAAFEAHRVAIERVVVLATERAVRVEGDANSFVSRSIGLLIPAVLLALLGALILGLVVARAIVRPVRALRRVATQELPSTIETLRTADSEALAGLTIPSVQLGTRDELNDAAIAFNEVVGTAVGLAADQAKLRQHLVELMVNLGRRNQVLLGSQLDMLDRMETSVDEPELLDGLFELDHLAARMRRNAESLLVLAGSRRTRSWSGAVLLSEVIQGAVSELSDFRRVDVVVPVQDDVAVSGQHTVDVAHILAELIENALQFSSPSTRVVVRTQRPKRGLRVWVSDLGIGMSEEELASANDRVARPPDIDELNADQVGFQVVARLSRRIGALVRMQPHPAGGLAVALDLPPSVFATDDSSGRLGARPVAMVGAAPPASSNRRSSPAAVAGGAPSAASALSGAGQTLPARRRPVPEASPSAASPGLALSAPRSSAPTGTTADGLPQRRRAAGPDAGELPRRTAGDEPSADASFSLFGGQPAAETRRSSLSDFTRATRDADSEGGADGGADG